MLHSGCLHYADHKEENSILDHRLRERRAELLPGKISECAWIHDGAAKDARAGFGAFLENNEMSGLAA